MDRKITGVVNYEYFISVSEVVWKLAVAVGIPIESEKRRFG
ncbi:hypothetical protein [Lysinibacillus sp. fls2-241-R2A-57]|nr:hypothetical protein [Lysinibacillus sp. fls2-241-R2A-57]